MAAPKFKKNKVSQTINLKDTFGIDFRGKDSLKQAVGQAIIDRIVTRTESGKGMSFSGQKGRPVKLKSPYSKSYANSEDFKAFGKSKSKVNMSLTGDMLASMDITGIDGNSITISFEGETENAKAFNHSTGDTVPKRPFFGVNNSELKKIKSEFAPDIKEALKTQKNEGKKAFDNAVLALINKIGGVDGDS
jgi:hypothetical protein